jgi:biopolymer transport protein ExbD
MRTRKIFVRPQRATSADINVTPLIDVVLVLLIIFMVLTPLQEKDLEVQLPEVAQTPEEEALPEDQVVVGITVEGRFTVNTQPVTDEDYVPRLKSLLGGRPAGQKLLFFTPAAQARYERLVVALSGAKEAGAETLGMVISPKQGR